MTIWIYLALLLGIGITLIGFIAEKKDGDLRDKLYKLNIILFICLTVLRIAHWIVLTNM